MRRSGLVGEAEGLARLSKNQIFTAPRQTVQKVPAVQIVQAVNRDEDPNVQGFLAAERLANPSTTKPGFPFARE